MTIARKRKPSSRAGWTGEERRSEARFEALLFDISTRFIALPVDRIADEILRAQQEVCECLGLDISSMWEMPPGDPTAVLSTHVYVPPDYRVPVLEMDARDFFPWSMSRLFRGETVVLSRMSDIPPEGARDLEIYRYYKIHSAVSFPLAVGGGPIFGVASFNTFRKPLTWTADLIDKLGLVAQVFGNAIYRKRIDLKLRENEARYRGLFEDSLEGIYRTSPAGKVLFVNPAMAGMLGYDSPEDVLRSVTDLAGQVWADPEERARFIHRLEKEGAVRAYECRFKRKDGFPVWVSISVLPMRGPGGQIAHFDGFADNIEERKSTELALADSVKRYRTLFEVAPAGIIVVGLDGRVLTANSLQASLYGYDSPRQLEGLFTPHFVAEKDRERASLNMKSLLQGKELGERSYTAVRRDGSEFAVEVTSVALRGPHEELQGYLCLTRDITKSQQDEMERTELRLERTHLARVLTVDEISTSLAHEINQPLGAILNNAEAARILLAQGPDKALEVPEIVEDIIQDARRAGDIIRKVRRVLKKSDALFERLPVNGLIGETLEIVQNNLILNNVTLRTELAPDLADVGGDRVRLQQVVLNLVTNALDAMKEAPSKVLTLRSAMDGPDTVRVSVGDSGPGVAEAHQGSVFQPFFTTKRGGLGLGLSICRSIIEEHEGRIWQVQDPGGGAIFSFSLKAWRDQRA
ncbi:MAG: PAS domain S-box protein [Candidatus Aminicenantes bacterium]|nr:PAS domain S-box protein [Candidatus Aminicenantes bacterium]